MQKISPLDAVAVGLPDIAAIASELSDWFEDPAIISDWLLEQQERMSDEHSLPLGFYNDGFDDSESVDYHEWKEFKSGLYWNSEI